MYIVAIDPSGNFDSGKGRTGIAVGTDDGSFSTYIDSIDAKNFNSKKDYWNRIIKEILQWEGHAFLKSTSFEYNRQKEFHVVIENFLIRNNGFTAGTMPETIRLIGAIEYTLMQYDIPYTFQSPSAVKTRFNNEVLLHYFPELTKSGNYFKFKDRICNDHERDALRHLMYFIKYGGKNES